MLNFDNSRVETFDLETCVRTALESGELLPGAEAQIDRLVTATMLSPRDRYLLKILRDAIRDGCIRIR
jgi:hypothetical protein